MSRGCRAASLALAGVLRGVLGVLLLIVSAADELAAALLGTAPVVPVLRRVAWAVASEYRAARAGAVTAEVIDQDRRRWR